MQDEPNLSSQDQNIGKRFTTVNANDLTSDAFNMAVKKEKSEFEKDRKEMQKLLNALNPSEEEKKNQDANAQNQQNKLVDPEVDWFNFETRIRKVIYEVVEPLTKKQFETFDGFDDMKKTIHSIGNQYQETLSRIDKVILRNNTLDAMDKYTKDIELELLNTKAIQRNDVLVILEKMETWAARWRATQNDVNNFQRFEDKINKVQKTFTEATDQYRALVIHRIKEMSLDFRKQITDMDDKYRNLQNEMQEVNFKVQTAMDFSQDCNLRFENLNTMIEHLRDNLENSSLTYTQNKAQNDNRTSHQLLEIQQELLQLRQSNIQFNNAFTRPQIDVKDVERMIIQSQIDMFETIFGQNFQVKKVNEFHQYMINQYIDWRNQQVDKFEDDDPKNANAVKLRITDRIKQFSADLTAMKRSSMESKIQKNNIGDLKRSADTYQNQSQDGGKSNLMMSDGLVVNLQQRNISIQANGTEPMVITQNEGVQLTDKNSQQLMKDSIQIGSQNLNISQAFKDDKSNISQVLSARLTIMSPNDKRQSHQQQMVGNEEYDPESFDQQHYDSMNDQNMVDDLQDESFDEQDFQAIMRKLVRHPLYLSEERIQNMIQQSFIASEKNTLDLMADLKDQFYIKYNLDKFYQQVHSLKDLQEKTMKELKFVQNNEMYHGLTNQIQRVETQLSINKNDLQQQIYKLKEFNEQLYAKQIEMTENLDLEVIKMKRERSDSQLTYDKINRDLQGLRLEDTKIKDMLTSTAEMITVLVELQTVHDALVQQDDYDRKTPRPDQSVQAYNPSQIHLNGQIFQRQHLIYSLKVLLETQWLAIINKQPFCDLFTSDNNLNFFYQNLNNKLIRINQDFQERIDMINKEYEKQNRGLPKEITLIKERLENKKVNVIKKPQQDQSSSIDNSDFAQTNSVNKNLSLSRSKMYNETLATNKTQSPINIDKNSSKERITLMPDIQQSKISQNLLNSSAVDYATSSSPYQLLNQNSIEQPDYPQSIYRSNQAISKRNQSTVSVNKSFNLSNQDLPKQKQPLKGTSALMLKNPNYQLYTKNINRLQQRSFATVDQKDEEGLVLAPLKNVNVQKFNNQMIRR